VAARPRLLRRQSILILIFLLLVIVFMTTFRMGVVRGASMLPTYQDDQVVLVRRKNWFSAPLKHNDVVLLKKDRDVIIKRVYRLEKEEIEPGYPEILVHTRLRGLSDYYDQKVEQTPQGPRTRLFVPPGYLVVLGDNLNVSEDSRVFGPVPESDVLGTVVNAPGPPYQPTTSSSARGGPFAPDAQTPQTPPQNIPRTPHPGPGR
jgi:signal peptidase I